MNCRGIRRVLDRPACVHSDPVVSKAACMFLSKGKKMHETRYAFSDPVSIGQMLVDPYLAIALR